MSIDVSVVIAAKNEERYVAEALDSVLAQAGLTVEIVFIDDGSTDRTREIVEAIASRHPNLHVRPNPKRGKVSAFNLGVSLARGDWITLFAGDDLMPPDALAARWSAVKDVKSDRPVMGLCRLITMSEDKSQDGHLIPRSPNKGAWSGASYLMERRTADLLYPIPEQLPNEDTWLELAAQHLDLHLVTTPVIGVQWRVHAGNSINFLIGFDEFNAKLTPRFAAAALFLEQERPKLSPERVRALEKRVRCEEMRKAGRPIGILLSGAPLIDRLRAVSLSGPLLYAVRKRLYGLLSGW